jgi:hypothetical protein
MAHLEHEIVGGLQVSGSTCIAYGGVHGGVVRVWKAYSREQITNDALCVIKSFGGYAEVSDKVRFYIAIGKHQRRCPQLNARCRRSRSHLEQWHVVGKKLAQVDVQQGAQHEHVPASCGVMWCNVMRCMHSVSLQGIRESVRNSQQANKAVLWHLTRPPAGSVVLEPPQHAAPPSPRACRNLRNFKRANRNKRPLL